MNKLTTNDTLSLKDELHARPYIKLGSNLRTFHFAYLIRENDEKKSWSYLDKFLRKINFQKLPNESSKYWVAEGKDLTVRYECHTEFISLTLIYPNKIENRVNSGINVIDGGYLDNTGIIACIYHNQEKYNNIHINSFIQGIQQKKDNSFFEEGILNLGVWIKSLDIDYDKANTKIWETTKKEEE